MKCKYTVQDGGDGRCSKNAVAKYVIDGESNFCRLHHYMFLSETYENEIAKLKQNVKQENTPEKTIAPSKITGVFTFDLNNKTPITIKLTRFTHRDEIWHLSGSGPANELMFISVHGSTIYEQITSPSGEWQFDLKDWHIPANIENGSIRVIFPELHSPKGETYIINFETNKVGNIQKQNHSCKPIRIKGFNKTFQVICEICGKWIREVTPSGSDPQF